MNYKPKRIIDRLAEVALDVLINDLDYDAKPDACDPDRHLDLYDLIKDVLGQKKIDSIFEGGKKYGK